MGLIYLLPLLAAAMTAAPALADGTDIRARWHTDIEHGYQQLADSSAGLEAEANHYCESPSDSSRAKLEEQWREAFSDWQAVRFVNVGPIEQHSLAWQFQFWPDPKNLIARKAGYYLGLGQPVTSADVDKAGVAVQGFPMLEYLLFDTRQNQGDQALPATQSCSLLTAVSHHLAGNADDLATAWTELRPHFLDTPRYTEATVEAGMGALEQLEERRLAGPMGLRGGGKRSVYGADAWRSGQSVSAIEASLQGLYDYYLPGLTLALQQSDQAALAARIRSQFDDTLARFDSLPENLQPLLADDRFAELQGLYADLSQLASLVNDQAGPALGVVRGFNSSDGD